ncbi:hypothetical protein [Bacillus bombysepticus]|uniref:hypothetical protein n=1 Tax=Bacillus bombysepticus TaxID=658666 RepID=UPI0030162585
MKKTNLYKFIKEERGDIVQYMLLLALLGVILAFAAPFIKSKMKSATQNAGKNIDDTFSPAP